jgi:hypothetical protein
VPEVHAVQAGAVYEVYGVLEDLIMMEIDAGEETALRQLLIAAMDEAEYWDELNDDLLPNEEPIVRPAPSSKDLNEWSTLIDELRTTILDDYDFHFEPTFRQGPPDMVTATMRFLSIPPNYFTSVPDDPKPKRIPEIQREFRKLVRGHCCDVAFAR